ncbi:PLP-dependent aminotransferase family protein [Oceanimonas baumannii]|uniref:2-aminoadipate transaminase n=1 Tax=Oceanimonas baumannii TaxID=129578 RepID=A0A235CJ60_9GAMM|nr:PLP-dependent aminotransferase family protein [Oceanimonas baumannii]OYD24641.1 aspartate aminotransferase [Oceanimonas baumannii]TDW59384.1 2-aminoadipate transaminase [Oceanimonas baumannii]
MQPFFAKRFAKVEPSFIREILKVAVNPEVISFAGGLPNPEFFPNEALEVATAKVLQNKGNGALQYAATEGFGPLREYIAARYQTQHGMTVNPDNILITNGSQQALDLLGKVLVDEGAKLIIEEPGYLGAIQALSVYQPEFQGVPLNDDGPDLNALDALLAEPNHARVMYGVTNFQNPSGLSYSLEKRKAVAERLVRHNMLMVEDNPYGELRFEGEHLPPIAKLAPENVVLLGSFSKVVVPSFRLGWMLVPDWLRQKITIAKQASDLHTNGFVQQVLYSYLQDNSLDAHIDRIRTVYGEQKNAMEQALLRHCPGLDFTRPEGGMFLWLRLPEHISAMELFNLAIKENVAFVPGQPFYVRPDILNTARFSYSGADAATIEEGISRFGRVIRQVL